MAGEKYGVVDGLRYAQICFAMNSPDAQPAIPQSSTILHTTAGARVIKGGIGLLLMLAGSVFVAWLWHGYKFAEETRHWPSMPCIVVSSQVLSERRSINSPMSYRAGIRYRFTYEGKTWTGSQVRRVEGWSSDEGKAREIVANYPAGRSTQCFVNPAKPEAAILEHSTLAARYAIWFPLLFMVGGTGMLVSALFTSRR